MQIIFPTMSRLFFVLMIGVSLYMLFRGHNEPGGGFIGGLIAALGFALLAMAHNVDAARKASMTKDTLERAIKKGAGLLDEGLQYDTVFYEGFAPHQVPVIVECLTENRNRTSANIRVLFRKGQLGATGSVSWDFARLGAIEASHEDAKVDPEEAAIEAGAQDLEAAEDGTTFYTEPTDLDAVGKALAEQGWTISASRLIWKAKNPVVPESDAARAEVEAFLEALDEDDDVQSLYVALG